MVARSPRAVRAPGSDSRAQDDAQIAVSESGIKFPGQTEVPDEAKVHATWVLEKRDGQWLIAAYHNSPVQVPTP